MLKAVKETVHRMASHLQLISAYLEMEDYARALGKTRETIKGATRAGNESDGADKRGNDRAEGWGGRGSAWLYGGELRRCERGRRQ